MSDDPLRFTALTQIEIGAKYNNLSFDDTDNEENPIGLP